MNTVVNGSVVYTSNHVMLPPGVFNDQGVSDLGRLVYHVTLPSLLFVNILREVSHDTIAACLSIAALSVSPSTPSPLR